MRTSGGIDPNDPELEEFRRWADSFRRACQRSISIIDRARKSAFHAERNASNGRMEKAKAEKARLESEMFRAIGVAVDPDIAGKDAADLAFRTVAGQSLIIQHARGKNEITGTHLPEVGAKPHDRMQSRREMAERIDAFASEVLKQRTASLASHDIVAALAERGWNASRIAGAWDSLLTLVFAEGTTTVNGRGSIKQRKDALKMLLEWKRSLEPSVVVDVQGDVDEMTTEQLERVGQKLTKLVAAEVGLPMENGDLQ